MKVRIYVKHGFAHRDRAYRITLHARSRLFMTILIGKSCWTSVGQTLSCYYFVGMVLSLSLPLPTGVSHSEDDISRARYHSSS
jgi:hypothetical protein